MEEIVYSLDPVQSRMSALCARKRTKRHRVNQSGETMLRAIPTSFITSFITQLAIFENLFLGIAATLAAYCHGNKCSKNRFVCDCAFGDPRNTLI